jgi:hypothetical protein
MVVLLRFDLCLLHGYPQGNTRKRSAADRHERTHAAAAILVSAATGFTVAPFVTKCPPVSVCY